MFLKRNLMAIRRLGQCPISNNTAESTEKRPHEGPSVEEGKKRKPYRRGSSDEDDADAASLD